MVEEDTQTPVPEEAAPVVEEALPVEEVPQVDTQSHQVPFQYLEDGVQEDNRPVQFKTLFPDESLDRHADLTKITETSSRMILPMVRMRVIQAAADIKRTDSLIEVFVREFDRRMISRDRKGRLEAIELMQASKRAEQTEEEESLGI